MKLEKTDSTLSGMDPASLLEGLRLLRRSGLWSTNRKTFKKIQSLHQPLLQDASMGCASVVPLRQILQDIHGTSSRPIL